MNSGRTSDYSSDTSSGRFSSALSRLKYSDYKPLMRTFTRRFDSPPKVNINCLNCLRTLCLIENVSCSPRTMLQRIERKRRFRMRRLRSRPSPDWSQSIPTFLIASRNESKNNSKRKKIAIKLWSPIIVPTCPRL